MDKKIDVTGINKVAKVVQEKAKSFRRKLPDIPPDTFEHQKNVDAEFATLEFKKVKMKLFPEDEAKLKTLSRDEKTEYMRKIRQEHRYTVEPETEPPKTD